MENIVYIGLTAVVGIIAMYHNVRVTETENDKFPQACASALVLAIVVYIATEWETMTTFQRATYLVLAVCTEWARQSKTKKKENN